MDELAITFQGAVLDSSCSVFRRVICLTRTHWAPSNTNRFCLHKVEFNPGQETEYTFAQRARAEILHRVFKLNKGFKTQREVLVFLRYLLSMVYNTLALVLIPYIIQHNYQHSSDKLMISVFLWWFCPQYRYRIPQNVDTTLETKGTSKEWFLFKSTWVYNHCKHWLFYYKLG